MDDRSAEDQSELSEVELLVKQSSRDLTRFEPSQIADALIHEAGLSRQVADQISNEVKDQIQRLGMRSISPSLIRELVDSKLLEYGLVDARRAQARLGLSLYDVDGIIQALPRSHTESCSPESAGRVLADAIKRDYAMLAVFSDAVATAHLSGDLHIGNLGDVDRATSFIGSVDLIKLHGVTSSGGIGKSRPARRAEVLAAHLARFTRSLQQYSSEPVAWDSLNYGFAPYLDGISEREVKQVAEAIVFGLASPSGKTPGCEIHLDIDPPAFLRGQRAIGPGGERLDEGYEAFADSARRLLAGILEVALEGDGQGFALDAPGLILHVTTAPFEERRHRELLYLACQVAAEKGGLRFAFDRFGEKETAHAFSSRYGIAAENAAQNGEPSHWRSWVVSSIALNLPRIGYRAEGGRLRVFELLTRLMELAAQASLEKRVFLEKLLARGESGSLGMLAMKTNSGPLLQLNRTVHAICPIGMSELAEAVFGKPLDASHEAQDFAAHLIDHLRAETVRLSAKHKVRFVLAESRDTNALHRIARLDLRMFGREMVIQSPAGGEGENGEYAYYSNGVRLPASSVVRGVERQRIEGAIQHGQILNAGSEIWLGSSTPTPARLTNVILQVLSQTGVASLTFAPELTICLDCGCSRRGLLAACPECGSQRIAGLAVERERLSRTSTWPGWKLAVLKRRKRQEF